MQTFSRILEVLLQHKQGGTLMFGWTGELTEGRRVLGQTGHNSQIQHGGLSGQQPCCSTSAGTGRLAGYRSDAVVLTGQLLVGSCKVLCFSLWDLVYHSVMSMFLLHHLMSKV